MKHKTILHLTGMKSTKYGSLEHYLIELSRFCQQKGYKSILQYESQPISEKYLLDLKANDTDFIILKTDNNPVKCILAIFQLIRSVKPDIINTHFIFKHVLFLVPIIAKLLGVKKTVHVQHSIADFKSNSKAKRYFYKISYNMYDWVLGVSSAVTDDILTIGTNSEKVVTNYLGLFGKRQKSERHRDQFRKEFRIPEKGIAIGCIAFDTPFKGLDILLEVISKIISNNPHIYLIVIGVNPDLSDLPKQAVDLGLSEHVHWAGIRDDGWKILNAVDIYVQPSRYGEGLSLSIMEALALKLPVIATRAAGNQEAVCDGKTGYLCEPGSVDSLVNAFERLILDQTQWNTMGEAGYNRFQQLFWGPMSLKKLVELYYGLVEE